MAWSGQEVQLGFQLLYHVHASISNSCAQFRLNPWPGSLMTSEKCGRQTGQLPFNMFMSDAWIGSVNVTQFNMVGTLPLICCSCQTCLHKSAKLSHTPMTSCLAPGKIESCLTFIQLGWSQLTSLPDLQTRARLLCYVTSTACDFSSLSRLLLVAYVTELPWPVDHTLPSDQDLCIATWSHGTDTYTEKFRLF